MWGAIEAAEKEGVCCGICKGKLTLAQHEQALLVEAEDLQDPDLKTYLKSIVAQAEKDKFAGFAFTKKSR